jgi:hypothetical protein
MHKPYFHLFLAALTLGAGSQPVLAADAAASTAQPAAPATAERRIMVKMQSEKKTETRSMSSAELGKLLKEMGMSQELIDKGLTAAKRDGKLTIQAKVNPPAKK